MFDWTTQLRFGVEFATFLVAAAGAFVLALRPRLVGVVANRSRVTLALGLLGLAVAAFIDGSVVVDEAESALVLTRGAAIMVLALGTFSLRDDARTRTLLWTAVVLLAAGEAATIAEYESLTQLVRALGVVGLGAVLVVSAGRSITARMAVSTAASLLVVVLAVSVGLSAVIADNLTDSAQRRVASRALAEVAKVESGVREETIITAKLVALSLQGNRAEQLRARDVDGQPDPTIQADLDLLTSSQLLASPGPLIYANSSLQVVAYAGIGLEAAQEVTTLDAARAVGSPGAEGPDIDSASTVAVVGGRAFAFGMHAIRLAEGEAPVGVVVASEPLDGAYLASQAQADPDIDLALVAGGQVLASAGVDEAALDTASDVAGEAAASAQRASRTTQQGFFAAQPVDSAGDGSAVVMVSTTPTTSVEEARRLLFQRLYLIGLVTVLGVLAVTIVVGERINRQLRVLTTAAEGIRRGDLTVRAAVASRDELGLLGEAFDSMAGSIESMADELRQAAEEETDLRMRLEAVVAGMGEALVAVDAEGIVLIFNEAAEELFALPATQVVGRPLGEALTITSDRGADVADRLSRPLPGSWSDAAQVVRSDGVHVPVALSAGGLRDYEGEVVGGVYVLRDVGRDREIERMKTDFLSNISHELRTPLVPIRGFAELLRSRRVPHAQAQEFLDRILEASAELERVVDLLVSVAADDAARLTLRQEAVDVRGLIDSVLERWRDKVGPEHKLTRRVERRLPRFIGDRRLLERALDELVDNAVKYSPDGGKVLLSVTVSPVSDSDELRGWTKQINITVKDEGVGIPEDRLADIFGDFAQADPSMTRRFGGMGLGLAFVRRIVRAHQGTFTVDSEPGRGSSFVIVLPVASQPGT